MLADMIIWIPWTHCSAEEQQNKAHKRGKEANNKYHQKPQKKEVLSEYCQIHNRNKKKNKLNEPKLETNTTACKYLNKSRHGNLLLRKYSLQIVDMCDAFIWTLFNLFDPNCTIDSKVASVIRYQTANLHYKLYLKNQTWQK